MNRNAWWALPAIAGAAAACVGQLGADNSTGAGSGGGKSGSTAATMTTTNTTGTSAGGSSSSAAGGAATINLACPAPALGSPVLRLLNSSEFDQTLTDIFPEVAGQWTNTLPADTVSAFGFDNDGAAVVGQQYAQAVLDTATSLATALTATSVLSTVLPCSTSTANSACAETFLVKYGRRLFRRPITTDEHDRYLTFFTTSMGKSDFPTALKWMTIGLIQSPNALYRSEIGTVNPDGTRQLSLFEIVTELAYTYLGSTPTDALISQAESGSLGDAVTLATSLLASTSGKQTLQHFFEGYLEYTKALGMEKPNIGSATASTLSPDEGTIPYDSVRSDMASETRAFIDNIVFQQDQGLGQLLTSPTTNPSKALATYYGFPAPATDYASITRPTGRGIGLLALGAVLASHSQPDGSSPTQRGLLVFQKMLCETKPTPPPNVPQIGSPQPGKETTRERYEVSHAQPGTSCAACHARFDPIGFGFEHFNEGGIYRQEEAGLTINSADGVPNPDGNTSDPALFQFQGEEDLVQGLSTQPLVYQCFAAYLSTYAFGTGQSCLGSSRVADFQAGKIGIANLFAALAAEPHFTTRASQ